MKAYKLGDVIENFDSLRVPLSENQRNERLGKYRYFGAQEVIGYIDDYIFDGEYILVAEDGNNLISGNKPLCTLVEGKFWVNNHAHIIKANDESNTKYILYLLNNINIRGYVTGSAQPKLTQANLNKIKIQLPDVNIQNNIAHKIFTFDRKINLNYQLISTLEEYSQLNFHKWFVDFNFPDKEGKPYKDNGGEMYEVDGKMIPIGWKNIVIGDMVSQTISGDWGNKEKEEGLLEVLCIRGADIPNWNNGEVIDTPIRFIKRTNNHKKMLTHGDIIIEASGGSPIQSTGRTVLIRDSILKNVKRPVYCSNFSKIIRPKSDKTSAYLYYLLKNLYKRGVFFHYEGKTTGIKNLLLQSLMDNFNIYKPSDDVLKKFEDVAGLIMDKIYMLGKENELLKETRNLLIKKLIK